MELVAKRKKNDVQYRNLMLFLVEFLLNRGMVGEHSLRFLFLLQGAFFFLPQITPKKNPKNVKNVV